MVPLLGAIVVCYGGGRGVVCYGWGGRVTTNFGAIAGCHCRVLWWGKGRVKTNFGGVDVPLQGAHGTLHSNGIQKKHPEKLP